MANFKWTCSYMGCRWYRVMNETGSYEIVERYEASDYENSIYNHNSADWQAEVLNAIGTIRRSYNIEVPIPRETVEEFNAWRLAERTKIIASMDAQPERYGLAADDPIRTPLPVVIGAVYRPNMGIINA